jgi:hypothetical protein
MRPPATTSIQAARAYKASVSASPPSADGYRSDRTKGRPRCTPDIPDRHVVTSKSRRQSPAAARHSDPCVPGLPVDELVENSAGSASVRAEAQRPNARVEVVDDVLELGLG